MSLVSRYDQAMMAAYGLPPLAISHGSGCELVDVDGQTYLDLDAGSGVNILGYGHEAVLGAITEQAAKVIHVSTAFATEPQVELAERLQACLSDEGYVGASSRIFFTNSGSEAIDAAIKMAQLRKPGGRVLIFDHAYQAVTPGALFADPETDQASQSNVVIDKVAAETGALEEAFSSDVSALIVEPILSGSSITVVGADVLQRARSLCDLYGALLVIDESQTGMGRTGRWFAHSEHVKADVITVGKGFGGGIPIGAAIGVQRAGRLIQHGHESVSTGGNPLATASALAVVNEVASIKGDAFLTGAWLKGALSQAGFVVTGEGLLLGVEIENAPRAVEQLREIGFIVTLAGSGAIKLTPPLTISREQLASFVDHLSSIKENA